MQSYNRQYGFTLLEILLVSALSSLLFISLFSIFFEINHGDQWRQKITNFVEEIQSLENFITDRIKKIGDARCLSLQHPVDMQRAIHGYKAENVPKEWGIQSLSQSDVLIIAECMLYQQKYQFVSLAFFVADSHRQDEYGHEIYSIYQKVLGGHAEELVANIQMMNVLYGISQSENSNISQYLIADAVTDWQAVRSVELSIQDESVKKFITFYIKLREQFP